MLTLDPHSQNHTTTTAILQHSYEGLTRYTRDYKVEGALATEWKSISPTQIRFLLRKGVRFHDGSPFTADDVVFSFGRIKSPTSTMQAYVAGVSEVKKIDSHTVDFLLSAPNPILTRTLVDFRIMSKAWAEKNKTTAPPNVANKEETFATRNSLGTGPYRITGWQPEQRITQIIERLQRVFGDQVDVYHSRLNNNERVEIWNRTKEGKALGLGARSALWRRRRTSRGPATGITLGAGPTN